MTFLSIMTFLSLLNLVQQHIKNIKKPNTQKTICHYKVYHPLLLLYHVLISLSLIEITWNLSAEMPEVTLKFYNITV